MRNEERRKEEEEKNVNVLRREGKWREECRKGGRRGERTRG